MKILIITFLLLQTINNAFAKEDNVTLSDSNAIWHFAIGAEYSSGLAGVGLAVERSFENTFSLLVAASMDFKDQDYGVNSIQGKVFLMNYLNDDAYLLEGFHYYGAIGIGKELYPVDILNLNAEMGLGYGWHFFNHNMMLSVDWSIKYTYSFWNDPLLGDSSGGIFYYPLTGRIGFIF